MRNEIIEELQNYYEQYLYLCDIYYASLDSTLAEEYTDKGNTFFLMATSACIDSYMMTLARFFDKDGKSAKISELINKCKQNKDVFNNPKEVFEYLTEKGRHLKKDPELQNAVKVIRHRRDHYFAHNDHEYFSHSRENDKAVQDKSYLPAYQIWLLIKFIKELLEKLMEELSVDPNKMQPKYNRDLDDLIPSIKKSKISPIK
ncbi:hypothetical protein [Selenomonas sp. AE3005]|uniref:AbiU2 domain-containing protein n=1 Tax=Selenomonas sp. AE3005 TaxID=1485543 RepID=UPI0025D88B9A|nr:hypothetical protein [Selenomonas sp. AE3005]